MQLPILSPQPQPCQLSGDNEPDSDDEYDLESAADLMVGFQSEDYNHIVNSVKPLLDQVELFGNISPKQRRTDTFRAGLFASFLAEKERLPFFLGLFKGSHHWFVVDGTGVPHKRQGKMHEVLERSLSYLSMIVEYQRRLAPELRWEISIGDMQVLDAINVIIANYAEDYDSNWNTSGLASDRRIDHIISFSGRLPSLDFYLDKIRTNAIGRADYIKGVVRLVMLPSASQEDIRAKDWVSEAVIIRVLQALQCVLRRPENSAFLKEVAMTACHTLSEDCRWAPLVREHLLEDMRRTALDPIQSSAHWPRGDFSLIVLSICRGRARRCAIMRGQAPINQTLTNNYNYMFAVLEPGTPMSDCDQRWLEERTEAYALLQEEFTRDSRAIRPCPCAEPHPWHKCYYEAAPSFIQDVLSPLKEAEQFFNNFALNGDPSLINEVALHLLLSAEQTLIRIHACYIPGLIPWVAPIARRLHSCKGGCLALLNNFAEALDEFQKNLPAELRLDVNDDMYDLHEAVGPWVVQALCNSADMLHRLSRYESSYAYASMVLEAEVREDALSYYQLPIDLDQVRNQAVIIIDALNSPTVQPTGMQGLVGAVNAVVAGTLPLGAAGEMPAPATLFGMMPGGMVPGGMEGIASLPGVQRFPDVHIGMPLNQPQKQQYQFHDNDGAGDDDGWEDYNPEAFGPDVQQQDDDDDEAYR